MWLTCDDVSKQIGHLIIAEVLLLSSCAEYGIERYSFSLGLLLLWNKKVHEAMCWEGVYREGVCWEAMCWEGVYREAMCWEGVYREGVYREGVCWEGVYREGVCKEGVYLLLLLTLSMNITSGEHRLAYRQLVRC